MPAPDDTNLAQLLARHRSPDRPAVFTMFGLDWDLLPEVYAPVYALSSRLFTDWLPYPVGGALLEVGSGAGLAAVTAALRGCRSVTALDINPAAVENTRLNAERHGVAATVRTLHSDMFTALTDETFDVIFWNSNFVEAPPDTHYESDLARAFIDPGYAHHARYLAGARHHLAPRGRLLLGFSTLGNPTRLAHLATHHGYRITSLAHQDHLNPSMTFQLLEFQPAHP